MKRVLKRTARYGVLGARKIILKNPRIKNSLKRVLVAQLSPTIRQLGYIDWVNKNLPDYIDLLQIKKDSDGLTYRPLISIVVPTYNTDIDFLHECLGSVRAQVYENWELCIVDDASPSQEVRDTIESYAKLDSRIKYKFLKTNQHISGATNEAAQMATGEFISLLDHDDTLWPNALYEVVAALNKDKTLDFLYSDEDKITEDRHEHLGPFFKPDWNPDFLHSVNYITHFSTVRKTLFEKLGGLRKEYNGAQDWDFFMRISDATKRVHHIPKIVYSWRVHDLSTAKSTDSKPYVVAAQKQALLDDTVRKGHNDAVVEQDKKHPGYWHVSYPVAGNPLVSIVIPSKNQYKIVNRRHRSTSL